MTKSNPLITEEEMTALINGSESRMSIECDNFYPLRLGIVLLLSSIYCLALLIFPNLIARGLLGEGADVNSFTGYLYFRGWLLLFVILIAFYSYYEEWNPALVFGYISIANVVVLLNDVFGIFTGFISEPHPVITMVFIIRIMCIMIIYYSALNSWRMPNGRNKFNLLLFSTKGLMAKK